MTRRSLRDFASGGCHYTSPLRRRPASKPPKLAVDYGGAKSYDRSARPINIVLGHPPACCRTKLSTQMRPVSLQQHTAALPKPGDSNANNNTPPPGLVSKPDDHHTPALPRRPPRLGPRRGRGHAVKFRRPGNMPPLVGVGGIGAVQDDPVRVGEYLWL